MSQNDTSNFAAARSFAEFGLRERGQGRRESASGPGSALRAAQPTRQLLRRTLRQRNISSILDLGCGDWNWMRHMDLPDVGKDLDLRYQGWEASPALVAELSEKFAQPGKIEFQLRDATTAPLPEVDLVIARDILFHMPRTLALDLVRRISQSSRFLLSTSFLGVPENADIKAYMDIENWGFHRINLNAAPFDLGGNMLEAVCEPFCTNGGYRRYICLYDFAPRD